MQLVGIEEFEYRTNRPCRSGVVDGLELNRISKWSVVQIQQGAGGSPFAIQLEMDFNTIAEHQGPLDDQLQALFEELASLSERCALEGDRP